MTRIAAIQLHSDANVQANLDQAEHLIAEAVEKGARMVALPEMFATIALSPAEKLALKEVFSKGPLQTFLAEQAKKHGIWLFGGTIPLAAEGEARYYNTCLTFNDQGQCVGRYDKIHLFDVDLGEGKNTAYCESTTTLHGKTPCVVDTPFGKVGLAICYDVRFPALFQHLMKDNIDLIIMPTAFVKNTGLAHWEVLVRARAIENQCYFIAPNEVGTLDNGMKTYGHSMIVDPWGTILAELPDGNGVITADIDLDYLHRIRKALPVQEHRGI